MKGKIRISRYLNSPENSPQFRVDITDVSSGITFFRGEFFWKDFAESVTGSEGEIEYVLNGVELVGKKLEVKTVNVPIKFEHMISYHWIADERYYDEILSPYEVDGWKGSSYDLSNSRNYIREEKGSTCIVSFSRYV